MLRNFHGQNFLSKSLELSNCGIRFREWYLKHRSFSLKFAYFTIFAELNFEFLDKITKINCPNECYAIIYYDSEFQRKN